MKQDGRSGSDEDSRIELVKWRRWADRVIGGPGILVDDEARKEIERRLIRSIDGDAEPTELHLVVPIDH